MVAIASTDWLARLPAANTELYSATTRVVESGPAVRNVSSNMPTVRTSTRIEAARMPGSSNGPRMRVNTETVRAPDMRAAASIFGSICSMNGVIVSTTNGTEGTRLARMTPVIVPARWNLYNTVASGMPYVMGGIRIGRTNSSITRRL